MLMTPSFKHEKLVTITDDVIKLIAQNMKRSYYSTWFNTHHQPRQ